jgi:hypothetical protein
MAWFRDRHRIVARQWPLAGLLLVVSFLGHDLLMAAEAAAAPSEVVAVHHVPASPGHVAAPAALQLHDSPSEHPENCSIVQTAIPRSGVAIEHVD